MLNYVSTRPPSVRIRVVVSPRACGDEVLGWANGALRIRVAAPGRKGRADDALEVLLADVLDVPRSRVRVVAGRGTRRKWVEIENYDDGRLERRLPGRYAPAAPPRTPRFRGAVTAVQPASMLRWRRTATAARRRAAH